MGRELQKRKRRSSRPTVRQSQKYKKPLNPLGNSTIAKNWNKKETMTQNFRRMGLVARLKAPTGGSEPVRKPTSTSGASRKAMTPAGRFVINSAPRHVLTETKVERDADGKIVRVIGSRGRERDNPLNDPLNDLDSEASDGEAEDPEAWGGIDEGEDEEERPEVIRELEMEANQPVERTVRFLSKGEQEWLERLVAKHGDDTAAMARDQKLNPMQQTAADIRRRIKKWKKSSNS